MDKFLSASYNRVTRLLSMYMLHVRYSLLMSVCAQLCFPTV